jgi:hypothetical protein
MVGKIIFNIAFLASLLGFNAWSQTTPVARVAVSVGEAQKMSPAGQSERLLVGSKLMAGDRIRTGADGVAILVFSDEGRISLRADSELLIRHYEIDPTGVKTRIEIELIKGTVRQISGNASRSQPDRYRLNTPVAVIGVRGTDFLAKTSGDTVEAFVHEGKIILTPALGNCVQNNCAPVAMASSDSNLKYVRLSADGRIEQREFRHGELERVFGIEIARATNPNNNRASALAATSSRPIESAEAQLPEGTRLVTSTIFAAYTKAESQLLANTNKPNSDLVNTPAASPATNLTPEPTPTPVATPKPEPTPTPTATPTPTVPTPEPNIVVAELPKQLVWGRFSTSSALPQQMLTSHTEAGQGRHVTVGELFEYALWRANPSGAMSNDLRGQADFRLAGAEAVLVQSKGISTAKVTSATLGVDFDNSLFNATVGLQHATAGAAAINVKGKINDEGVFVGTTATDRVAGALSRDGTEAGYLFNKDVAAGTFRGITLWKR